MKKTSRSLALAAFATSFVVAISGMAQAQAVSDPRFAGNDGNVKTTGDQTINGRKEFMTNFSGQIDWVNSPISIRERGFVGATNLSSAYAPNINFHWGNRATRSLWMDADAWLNFGWYHENGTPGGHSGLRVGNLHTGNIPNWGNLRLNNGSPTIYLQDTDEMSSMIHANSNRLYFLRGCGANSWNWCAHNGRWPLWIDMNNNDAHFGGTVRAPAYLHNSDQSLKENIAQIDPDDVREKLGRLRPVSYDWKDTGRSSMGLIAQEIQLVFPDMVQADDEGILSVEYTQMIAPMIATIQAMEGDLEAEKDKNESLMLAIGSLEKRLAALEAALK